MSLRAILRGACVVVAAFSAALAGCGRRPGPGDERTRINMVVKASESEFWQIVMDGARTAARGLGIDLVAQAPVSESEVSKQIAIFENAISTRPDALILAPTSSDPLVPPMERAVREGLPLIMIDSAANTDQYTSFLASDNVKIGTLSADCMAKALEKRKGAPAGKIACLTFLSGANSLERRKSGFLERLAEKYPDVEVLAFRDAQGKTGVSINIVQDYLTKYPDLDGIYANNQPTGEETVRALDMAGKKGLAIVVVDAGEMEKWGLANGFVDYMIVQKPWVMGHMSVEYALKAARGEELPRFVDTGIVAITPEMLASGEAEEFLNPVEYHKKKAD
jgi:ribose transport system substrate-binding protein